jgi:hypothetical protein
MLRAQQSRMSGWQCRQRYLALMTEVAGLA